MTDHPPQPLPSPGTSSSSGFSYWPAFQNPPAFKAQKRGWLVGYPNRPARSGNANGIFTLRGTVTDQNPYKNIYTWVTSVQTGWSVQGTTGQSPVARTWFPKNFVQDDLTINGIVANQYEYDRLVEWITNHMSTALQVTANTTPANFKLLPYKILLNPTAHGKLPANPVYRYVHRSMNYDGYITSISAGHERFQWAPTWTMTMKISYDNLQPETDPFQQTNAMLVNGYFANFGTPYDPKTSASAPSNTNDAPLSTAPPSDAEANFWAGINRT